MTTELEEMKEQMALMQARIEELEKPKTGEELRLEADIADQVRWSYEQRQTVEKFKDPEKQAQAKIALDKYVATLSPLQRDKMHITYDPIMDKYLIGY